MRATDVTIALLAAASAAALVAALTWPMLLTPDRVLVMGSFNAGHIWAFDHIARMVTGAHPWTTATDRVGYPAEFTMELVNWGPSILVVPIRALLGPIAAYNISLVLAPALSTLVVGRLVQRLVDCTVPVAAAAGLSAALCPFVLGALSCGQTAKIQLWAVALPLLALSVLAGGPRRWLGLLGIVPAAAVAVFTAPSVMVYVPFLAGLVVLWEVWRRRGRRIRAALAGGLGLGLIAAIMLQASAYFQPTHSALPSAVRPSNKLTNPAPFEPPMFFAQIEHLLWGDVPLASGWHSSHVPYLGLAMLLALALALVLRARGAVLALASTAVGGLLALGPTLASGGQYVQLRGYTLTLPVAWLEALGWPGSGAYYRAVVVSAIGLAIGLGALGARLRRPWGTLLVWALALLHVADGLRVTEPLWPRPVVPIDGYEILTQWVTDPRPGAVLDLPVDTALRGSALHLASATLHGRPSTAILRDINPGRNPRLFAFQDTLDALAEAGDVSAAHARLHELGFAFVVYRPAAERSRRRRQGPQIAADLEALLGPAQRSGDLWTWTVQP